MLSTSQDMDSKVLDRILSHVLAFEDDQGEVSLAFPRLTSLTRLPHQRLSQPFAPLS